MRILKADDKKLGTILHAEIEQDDIEWSIYIGIIIKERGL